MGQNVPELVLNELNDAREYIRIAVFQIHNYEILKTLIKKAKNGVKIELFTLPLDSIHDETIRNQITTLVNELIECRGNVYFCEWNVGDPERTTTAVGVWYSYHGKFIVTDQSAISLSANLTQQPEIDALLIYRNEPFMIQNFNKKFDQLKELFITNIDGYPGKIRQRIVSIVSKDQVRDIFEVPRSIPRGTHERTWIRHYPQQLCPADVDIQEGLYVVPFDARGRNVISKIIESAKDFVYISAESFTDIEFPTVLKRIKLNGVPIKILAGATSMDYSERIEQFTKELLSTGIEFHTTETELHAKLIITENIVAVSSINLNRMNLGFRQTNNFWRENTETISICRDSAIIQDARAKYLSIFESSIDITDNLAEKSEKKVKNIFTSMFNVRSTIQAKKLLAKLFTLSQIYCEKHLIDVARLAVRLKDINQSNSVSDREVGMAIVLFFLTERKHDFNELNEKMNNLLSKEKLESTIEDLIQKN